MLSFGVACQYMYVSLLLWDKKTIIWLNLLMLFRNYRVLIKNAVERLAGTSWHCCQLTEKRDCNVSLTWFRCLWIVVFLVLVPNLLPQLPHLHDRCNSNKNSILQKTCQQSSAKISIAIRIPSVLAEFHGRIYVYNFKSLMKFCCLLMLIFIIDAVHFIQCAGSLTEL